MVRHVVSWNFKDEVPEERRVELMKELAAAFPTLIGKIPGLLKVEVGMPPLKSSNCDMVLYCEMEKEEDLAVYRDHPDHVAIAQIIRANCKERRCTDIVAD